LIAVQQPVASSGIFSMSIAVRVWNQKDLLLETFVENRALPALATKPPTGDTQGRGKLDVLHRNAQPIKSIWIYPLARDFQRQLCSE
jgi:hypothetical protein